MSIVGRQPQTSLHQLRHRMGKYDLIEMTYGFGIISRQHTINLPGLPTKTHPKGFFRNDYISLFWKYNRKEKEKGKQPPDGHQKNAIEKSSYPL